MQQGKKEKEHHKNNAYASDDEINRFQCQSVAGRWRRRRKRGERPPSNKKETVQGYGEGNKPHTQLARAHGAKSGRNRSQQPELTALVLTRLNETAKCVRREHTREWHRKH